MTITPRQEKRAGPVDTYLSGLETFVAHGGDPATVPGIASFSLRPVDAEVDRRLEKVGGNSALELRGLAAVAQAKLVYRLFEERFSTERWARLARCGARPQRQLWTFSGTDFESDHIRSYVEDLIASNTVHTLSESTVAALTANGTRGTRARHRHS